LLPVLFERSNIGSAHAVQIEIGRLNAEVEMCDIFTTSNSLKSQEMSKSFLPKRNIHARSQKLWSRARPATFEIQPQLTRPRQIAIEPAARSLVSLTAVSFLGGFRTTAPVPVDRIVMGPSSETLHKSSLFLCQQASMRLGHSH
jgi:hypothetical protein